MPGQAPADRYQTGEQLADELHRWLTDEEMPETEAESPAGRPSFFGFVTAAAVAVLLLGIGLGVWIRSNSTRPVEAAKMPPVIVKQSSPPPPPKVIMQYVRGPAAIGGDPPPMGYTEQMWANLPESTKRRLRRIGPRSRGGPGDRFNNHLPIGRDSKLLDPLRQFGPRSVRGPGDRFNNTLPLSPDMMYDPSGLSRHLPTGVDSSRPGYGFGR